MTGQEVFQFFLNLEGPYKWYALIAIVGVITAVLTHFVFKTLKWFLLIAAFGFIIFYLWTQLFNQLNQYWPREGIEPGSLKQKIELFRTLQNRANY